MRVLIWAKTYPELSERYRETVCTAGCTEDGEPVRLYPVPLRYLAEVERYSLYDWVEVPTARNTSDGRPESYKVIGEIRPSGKESTGRGWDDRRRYVFMNPHWHYDCVEELRAGQRIDKRSLGFVRVGAVQRVWVKQRDAILADKHHHKLEELKRRGALFDEIRHLAFQPFRVHVEWTCAGNPVQGGCPGHTAGIFDWGLGELGRRKGAEVALERMQMLCDPNRHELGFFLGNFKAHPTNFGIIGMWYPTKAAVGKEEMERAARAAQGDLFGIT